MSKKHKYGVTFEELLFVGLIAFMGFIFSMKAWLVFLNVLNPLQGLIIYYIILYAALFGLSKLGLVIWKFKLEHPLQILGAILITFAFFMIVGFSSAYTNLIVYGSVPTDMSSVYFQCEDGAVFYLWSQVIPPVVANLLVLQLLTYVLTPAILSLIGVILVSEVKIS